MRHVVIVGGGITGLSAAFFTERGALARAIDVRVTLLEAGDRLGGKVQTRTRDGFVLEAGPDAFVSHKPAALELVTALGLDDHLLGSNDAARGIAFIRHGRPLPLPAGMEMLAPRSARALLGSPLLGWPGKLRLLAERWLPRRNHDPLTDADESVGDFVRRRCGREVLERIAEPLLSSLHVGDIDRMSLDACCPHLARLEQRFGSLTRAARARPSGPTEQPIFQSLDGGMHQLIDALERRLSPESRRTGCAVQRIRQRPGGGFRVETTTDALTADAVVLAVPAPAAARILRRDASEAAAGLGALRTASVAVVSFGFARGDLSLPPGFGFFVPRREGMTVLGGTWTSVKFDRRAHGERSLVRLFVGGAHGERHLIADDDHLARRALADLARVGRVRGRPLLTQVDRWHAGYPQYDVGHRRRLQVIESACPAGLHLAGSAFHGVGLPDCVASAERAASTVLEALGTVTHEAPVPVRAVG